MYPNAFKLESVKSRSDYIKGDIHMDDILMDDILYKWEEDVNYFFPWLEEICGLHRDSDLYYKLMNAVKTNKDLELFVSYFDGDFSNIENTAYRYLLAKAS
jgi:hypothetical protein